MPAAVTQCPHGHDIRSSADRNTQGFCRQCGRERDRQRRVSNGMKLAIVKAFEDVGVEFVDDDGQPVAPAEAVRQMVAVIEAGAL